MSWRSGAFTAHSAVAAEAFAAMRGRPLDVIDVHLTRGSWAATLNPWWLDSAPDDFPGTLAVGVPLWPADGAVNADYMAQWQNLGVMLATAGYEDALIRPGWEMNLPLHSPLTAANKDDWIAQFRSAYTALKAVSPAFKIVWCPNAGLSQTGIEADEGYPGDSYVDVIGIDTYDWYPPATNASTWDSHKTGLYRLDWWLNFAIARGKKFCVPEWGLYHSPPAESGGNDNPYFISQMLAWFEANEEHIEYESYFAEPDNYIQSDLVTQNPNSRAVYSEHFTVYAPSPTEFPLSLPVSFGGTVPPPDPEPDPAEFELRFVKGVGQFLADKGIGVWKESGKYLQSETAITFMHVPSDIPKAIILTPYDSIDDPTLSNSRVWLQIRLKGSTLDITRLSGAIFNEIQALYQVRLSTGILIAQALRESTAILGQNQDGSWSRTDNYVFDLHRVSRNRS